MKNDSFLRSNPPLNAEITLSLKHNHNTESAEALKMLIVDDKVKEKFFEYFNQGMTPAEAMRLHENKFLNEDDFHSLANAAINPTLRQVNYLHQCWRFSTHGSIINPFEKLKEKIPIYFSEGTIVKFLEGDNWAVLIITDVMKRVQMLNSANEMIFIDSTSSCESSTSTLTIFLTATKAGALPIGVLIHPFQSTASYVNSFYLLKNSFPHCFGGKSHPKIFMTDDSSAEKAALKEVWPESRQLLCHFHVAQAEWLWLFANSSNIPHHERPRLMKLFQSVMYSSSETELEQAVATLLKEKESFESYVKRFQKFFLRKEEWVLFCRTDLLTRQNNTNNFCEATIRILKDVILCRTKAFNVVALSDFCISVWNTYLKKKLLDFAHSRRNEINILYKHLNKKVEELTDKDVTQLSEFIYTVASVTEKQLLYVVNTEIGVCSCKAGTSGAFCKHQYYLMKTNRLVFPNAPPVSAEEKFKLAKLALGPKCPPLKFFTGFTDNLEENFDCTPTEETIVGDNICVENVPKESVASEEEKEEFSAELKRLENIFQGNVTKDVVALAIKTLKKIRKPGDFKNLLFFSNYTSSRNKRINVQPTSLSRRREGLVRSKKRVPSGRPPVLNANLKRNLKRKRSLKINIDKNQPNAKSHGLTH